uniref:Uncharacterized protein n=1 Tax=Zea mays TaxID=4577 RepID=A0A804P3T5_MAIZE
MPHKFYHGRTSHVRNTKCAISVEINKQVTVAGVFSRSLVPFSRSPLSERSTTTALTDSSSCRWKIMSLEHVRNLKKLAAQSQTDDEDINDEGGGIREILCLHFKPRRKSVVCDAMEFHAPLAAHPVIMFMCGAEVGNLSRDELWRKAWGRPATSLRPHHHACR